MRFDLFSINIINNQGKRTIKKAPLLGRALYDFGN